MEPRRASDLLRDWRDDPGEKTVGGLIDTMGMKSFALLFIVLLGLPALPLPTGGITHVLEVVAMLLALQLVFGRSSVWLPQRWRKVQFEDGAGAKFIDGLITSTTKLERFSKPRLRWMFGHWWSDVLYGVAVLGGALAAFLAPPFTGLDTVPAMGVVILSVGVIMEDMIYVAAGFVLILVAPVLEITLGAAAYDFVKGLI